jgi:hypothetical protein
MGNQEFWNYGARTRRAAIATPDAINSKTMKTVIVKWVSFMTDSAQGGESAQ